MTITDDVRNALVNSGKFDRVYYKGKYQLGIERKHEYYIMKPIDDLSGLAALFG